MKRTLRLFNAFMGLLLLFAIVFQSFHSFEHLIQQFSKKYCHHVYHPNQTELQHGHDGLEKCFTCEFAFSSYTDLKKSTFLAHQPEVAVVYQFTYTSLASLEFNGSFFSLRAPPVI